MSIWRASKVSETLLGVMNGNWRYIYMVRPHFSSVGTQFVPIYWRVASP